MPTLERISGARIGGTMTAAGVQPESRVFASGGKGDRVVVVPQAALNLLRRAAIVPPPSGPLSKADVDAALLASKLPVEERLKVKIALKNCGLLAGR